MPTSSYPRVRGLEKGLAILQTLNVEGERSADQIAKITGIPRPTTHRILETLCSTGYVTRGETRGVFRLTHKVRLLADGYRDEDRLLDVAVPVITELQKQIVWPTDLLTFRDYEMVVRCSTHRRSPLSVHHGIVGAKFPLLRTGSGMVYLAFCDAREREEILQYLCQRPIGNAVPDRAEVKTALRLARARGYATSRHPQPARTSSLAVPIVHSERVLACLATVWITSAMPEVVAISRLLAPLEQAAQKIARSMASDLTFLPALSKK